MKIDDLRRSIMKHRYLKGMSANVLAVAANTTKSNILNFENGKANITLSTLERIMDALDLEVEIISK